MKTVFAILALASVVIGPHQALSETSYGAKNIESYKVMSEFCLKAEKDGIVHGALATLCD